MSKFENVIQTLESLLGDVYVGDKFDTMMSSVLTLRGHGSDFTDETIGQAKQILSTVRSDIYAEIDFNTSLIEVEAAASLFVTASEDETTVEGLKRAKVDLADLNTFCKCLYQNSIAEAFDNKAIKDQIHAASLTVRSSAISFASLRSLHDDIISSVSSLIASILNQFDTSLCRFSESVSDKAPLLITLARPNVSSQFNLADHPENVALEPLGLDQARLIGLTSILAGNVVNAAAFASPLITGVAMLLGATFSYKASKSGLARMSSKEFQRVVNANLAWYRQTVSTQMARTLELFVNDADAAIDLAIQRVERRLAFLREHRAALKQRVTSIRSECEATWASAIKQIDTLSEFLQRAQYV
jgi:hypothetical protein